MRISHERMPFLPPCTAGKKMWAGIDDRETTLAVLTAFDEGINTFDTAELYGF